MDTLSSARGQKIRKMHTKFSLITESEKRHLEDVGMDWSLILKCIFKKQGVNL
jgi:hypothetical protein